MRSLPRTPQAPCTTPWTPERHGLTLPKICLTPVSLLRSDLPRSTSSPPTALGVYGFEISAKCRRRTSPCLQQNQIRPSHQMHHVEVRCTSRYKRWTVHPYHPGMAKTSSP